MNQPNQQPTYFAYLHKLILNSPNLASLADAKSLDNILRTLENLPIDKQEELSIEFFSQFILANGNKELGFQIAKTIPITAYGKVGLGARMAPTLLDAIRYTAKYHRLVSPIIIYSLNSNENYTDFIINFNSPLPTNVEATLVAGAIYSLFLELQVLRAKEDTITEIHLKESSADYFQLYKKYINRTPIISNESNFIRLKTKNLNIANALSDPETYRTIIDEINNETKPKLLDSVHDQVTRIVKNNLSKSLTLIDIAKLLNLSERQIRFALAKDNTSYQEIVKECKLEFATRMLNDTQIPISVIADRLGYKDLAAFNHSFKRWTNKSPSSYRKNNSTA